MGTYKQNRTAEDIKREIAAIVRELKDPRISDHLISVARADVAGDLSYVKVYVSAINPYVFHNVWGVYDPELGPIGYESGGGYPMVKSFIGGLEITF